MNSNYRRKEIYEIIRQQGATPVVALTERFGVSAMTIRRDLDILEDQQLIVRSYGKALPREKRMIENNYQQRNVMHMEAKRSIAHKALALLQDVDSIYVDNSTTCNALIELLPENLSMTVYTNSVPALNLLFQKPGINTFVFGGSLSHSAQSLDSTSSLVAVKDIYVDAAFISCCGYNETKICNNDIVSINERRVMLTNANRRYLLADSSKQHEKGLFTICSWDMIDVFVTEMFPDSKIYSAILQNGVEIIA